MAVFEEIHVLDNTEIESIIFWGLVKNWDFSRLLMFAIDFYEENNDSFRVPMHIKNKIFYFDCLVYGIAITYFTFKACKFLAEFFIILFFKSIKHYSSIVIESEKTTENNEKNTEKKKKN